MRGSVPLADMRTNLARVSEGTFVKAEPRAARPENTPGERPSLSLFIQPRPARRIDPTNSTKTLAVVRNRRKLTCQP
jgi:hypothetical protein